MNTPIIRKQILLYDWLDKALKKMCKEQKISQSEGVRYAVSRLVSLHLDGKVDMDAKEADINYFTLRKRLEK